MTQEETGKLAANILDINLRMEELTFLQRFKHHQQLELILTDWALLRGEKDSDRNIK